MSLPAMLPLPALPCCRTAMLAEATMLAETSMAQFGLMLFTSLQLVPSAIFVNRQAIWYVLLSYHVVLRLQSHGVDG